MSRDFNFTNIVWVSDEYVSRKQDKDHSFPDNKDECRPYAVITKKGKKNKITKIYLPLTTQPHNDGNGYMRVNDENQNFKFGISTLYNVTNIPTTDIRRAPKNKDAITDERYGLIEYEKDWFSKPENINRVIEKINALNIQERKIAALEEEIVRIQERNKRTIDGLRAKNSGLKEEQIQFFEQNDIILALKEEIKKRESNFAIQQVALSEAEDALNKTKVELDNSNKLLKEEQEETKRLEETIKRLEEENEEKNRIIEEQNRKIEELLRRLNPSINQSELEPTTVEAEPHSGPATVEAEPQSGPATVEAEPHSAPATDGPEPQSGPATVEAEPQNAPATVEAEPQNGPATVEAEPHSAPATVEAEPHSGPATVAAEPHSGPATDGPEPQNAPTTVEAEPQSGPATATAKPKKKRKKTKNNSSGSNKDSALDTLRSLRKNCSTGLEELKELKDKHLKELIHSLYNDYLLPDIDNKIEQMKNPNASINNEVTNKLKSMVKRTKKLQGQIYPPTELLKERSDKSEYISYLYNKYFNDIKKEYKDFLEKNDYSSEEFDKFNNNIEYIINRVQINSLNELISHFDKYNSLIEMCASDLEGIKNQYIKYQISRLYARIIACAGVVRKHLANIKISEIKKSYTVYEQAVCKVLNTTNEIDSILTKDIYESIKNIDNNFCDKFFADIYDYFDRFMNEEGFNVTVFIKNINNSIESLKIIVSSLQNELLPLLKSAQQNKDAKTALKFIAFFKVINEKYDTFSNKIKSTKDVMKEMDDFMKEIDDCIKIFKEDISKHSMTSKPYPKSDEPPTKLSRKGSNSSISHTPTEKPTPNTQSA
ncbi:MAG: hypothetical protein K5769_04820 [Pseudobutyrivibrio sp.]|nr:hypothetical protein [Pseudobutyrivibrio sp.]